MTMAFAVAFVVEVGALAFATRHGSTFAVYVRWSLQMAGIGAALVNFVGWLSDRAEHACKAKVESPSDHKPE